jgi:hypothetical protein
MNAFTFVFIVLIGIVRDPALPRFSLAVHCLLCTFLSTLCDFQGSSRDGKTAPPSKDGLIIIHKLITLCQELFLWIDGVKLFGVFTRRCVNLCCASYLEA